MCLQVLNHAAVNLSVYFHVVWNVKVVRNLPLALTPCIAWDESLHVAGLDFPQAHIGDWGEGDVAVSVDSKG